MTYIQSLNTVPLAKAPLTPKQLPYSLLHPEVANSAYPQQTSTEPVEEAPQLTPLGQMQASQLQTQAQALPPLRAPNTFFRGMTIEPTAPFQTPIRAQNNCASATLANLALISGTIDGDPTSFSAQGFQVLQSMDRTLADIEQHGLSDADFEGINHAAQGINRGTHPPDEELKAMSDRRSLEPFLARLDPSGPDGQPVMVSSNTLMLLLQLNRAKANPQVLSGMDANNPNRLLQALDEGKPIILFSVGAPALGAPDAPLSDHINLLMKDSNDGQFYVIDVNNESKVAVSEAEVQGFLSNCPENVAIVVNNKPQWP